MTTTNAPSNADDEQADRPPRAHAGRDEHAERRGRHDHRRAEVGLQHDQHQRDGDEHEREQHVDRRRRPVRAIAAALREQHGQPDDQAELHELRRLDLEPAAEADPGVRAVDRHAGREHEQQAEYACQISEWSRAAQHLRVQPRRGDREPGRDREVDQVAVEVPVRVAPGRPLDVARRGPDEHRADQRQRERGAGEQPVGARDAALGRRDQRLGQQERRARIARSQRHRAVHVAPRYARAGAPTRACARQATGVIGPPRSWAGAGPAARPR